MPKGYFAYLWVEQPEFQDWNGAFQLSKLDYLMSEMRHMKLSGFYQIINGKRNVTFDFRGDA